MINKSFTFPKLLSVEECTNIVEYCSNGTLEKARVNVNGEYKVLESARKSKISFHSYQGEFDWLLDRISSSMMNVIKLKGYEIDFEAKFQFTHYGLGEHYGWHQDNSGNGEASNRAFSIVIQLSDGYTGGVLQFKDNGIKSFQPGIGTMYAFPSGWSHQVTPVTEGTRLSLVSWFVLKEVSNYRSTLL